MPADPSQLAALREPVDIKKLIPQHSEFYHFNGSLTTPPCSVDGRWVALSDPGSASNDQISQFQEMMHHGNNRPEQPLDSCVIVY